MFKGIVWTVAVAALVLAAVTAVTDAAVYKHGARHTKSWLMYMGKFCFGTEGLGSLTYDITPLNDDNFLCFYDDEDAGRQGAWANVWPLSHHKTMTCSEAMEAAKPLSGQDPKQSTYCMRLDGPDPSGTPVRNTNTIEFKNVVRAHYWFTAILNCAAEPDNADRRIDLQSYELHFTNAGGPWEQEFSFDAQGIMGTDLFFFLVLAAFAAVHVHGVLQLRRAGAAHPVVQLLTFCILAQLGAALFGFIHASSYAADGIGAPFLEGLGTFLETVGALATVLLFALLAQGWTISKLTLDGRKEVLAAVGGLSLVFLVCIIWIAAAADPASNQSMWATAPGIIVLIARMGVTGWLMWVLNRTRQAEAHPDKKRLYRALGGVFAFWLLSLPFFVLMAAAIPPPYRLKTLNGLQYTANTIVLGILSYLFWPTRASEYFKLTPGDMLGADESTAPYDAI